MSLCVARGLDAAESRRLDDAQGIACGSRPVSALAAAVTKRACRAGAAALLWRETCHPLGALVDEVEEEAAPRRAVAAWLGLFALVPQTLAPLLVAGEIADAAKAGDHSVFELCLFGHLHQVAPPGTPDGDRHRGDAGDLCPICVALYARPVFTTPTVAALPSPAVQAKGTPLPPQQRSAGRVASATYRSRAPPNG